MTEYKASWSTRLILTTLITTLILFGIPLFEYMQKASVDAIIWIAPAIWLISVLFIVRGYRIDNNYLVINRLLWDTKIDLSALKKAEYNPMAVRSSIRTFGNGGLFSFSGLFKNSTLGNYRQYSTNHKNTVILYLAAKTIVITPDNPENFVSTIKQFKNLV